MLEVRRAEPEAGRARKTLVALVALAVVVGGVGLMLALGRWWAAALILAVTGAAFAAPGVVLQWNWNRTRGCPHCGAHAARRDRDAGDLDHRRRYIPAYTRQPVTLRCGECGHLFSVRLARPYWGA